MPRPPSSQPTEVELLILRALWEHGPSTVREVHRALPADRRRGASTTLKMLQVMKEKGIVSRNDTVRPQVYAAARPQEQTQIDLIDDLVHKAFGGSASRLVLRALSAKRIKPGDLAEIRKLIREAEGDAK
jgi:BlaI family transcriptional regulator, penicillinase repressor